MSHILYAIISSIKEFWFWFDFDVSYGKLIGNEVTENVIPLHNTVFHWFYSDEMSRSLWDCVLWSLWDQTRSPRRKLLVLDSWLEFLPVVYRFTFPFVCLSILTSFLQSWNFFLGGKPGRYHIPGFSRSRRDLCFSLWVCFCRLDCLSPYLTFGLAVWRVNYFWLCLWSSCKLPISLNSWLGLSMAEFKF